MENKLAKEERIDQLKKMRWIEYKKASEIIATLSDLLRHNGTTRIPNPFIIGDSNSGKSEILRRFSKLNEPKIIEGKDYLQIPVLYIILPPKPSEQRLYNEILSTLRVPHRERNDIDYKMRQTIDSLQKVNCKIIIIDEIQQVLASPPLKQREFMNTLKYIMNKTGISIVCAGVKDAHGVIASDPQLASRFTLVELKAWLMNEEFALMLNTLKKSMKLMNDTEAIDFEFAKFVHFQSEGLLGEMAELIRKGAINAINDGSERLTLEVLKSVEWLKPSERTFRY